MRRFVPAAVMAVLALAVATPVNAGYLIIRVILEGASGSGSDEPGTGMFGGMQPPGGGGFGSSSSGGPPRGGMKPPRGGGFPGLGGIPPGPGGGMGAPGGAAAGGTHKHDPSRSLVVVVPIEGDLSRPTAFYPKLATNHFTNPGWRLKLHTNHRGEKFVTNIFTDENTIQLYDTFVQKPAARRTREFEVRELHTKWSRQKNDPKVLFQVVTTALEVGMVDEAVGYADELLAFATEKSAGLPPEVAGFAQAYKAMQSGIKSPASKPNTAEHWRLRLKAQNVTNQSHYSVISWDATEAEVRRRTSMLEENFKAFFLWHATRGIPLPIPEAPLIAVLAKTGNELIRLAHALDAPARLPADGFYSVEHDLLVISPERLDELGQTFTRQSQQIYQAGMGRDRLLGGDGPKLHINGENERKKPEEVARMQTLALVDRLVEDAATQATISREGSRQLLYATGQLPRFVELPEWLTNGSANFFARPKDPAFIEDAEGKPRMSVAMTTGYGDPNYVFQRYFRDLAEKKELHPDHGTLLKNVLTDAYFHGLRDPKNPMDPDPVRPESKGISVAGGTKGGSQTGGFNRPPKGGMGFPGLPQAGGGSGQGPPRGGSGLGPPKGGSGLGPPPGVGIPGGMGPGEGQSEATEEDDPATILRKKRDRLSIKAQSTAWALYYYLAKDHPDKLRRFLDELAVLPRDLPLDGDTVVAAFCRALTIENDKASLTTFANGWLNYINSLPPVSTDIALVELKPASAGASGGSGLLPGGAGGMPPGGSPIP